jgi:ABC-type Fe3+/spermidine/putrescine transport system ATPase subunit
MTVRENRLYDATLKKFGILKDTTALVKEALENVGLVNAIDLMPVELSGGMKRRIALARTLILQPKIILMTNLLRIRSYNCKGNTNIDEINPRKIQHISSSLHMMSIVPE